MALDPIRIGSDWLTLLTINPTAGRVNQDVTNSMTGANVLYEGWLVVDGRQEAQLVIANPSPANRTLEISLPASATHSLKPHDAAQVDLVLVEQSGKRYPIQVGTVAIKRVV